MDAQVVMPPLQGCDACPEENLTWGWQGGFVAFTEQLSLTSCPSFERIRRPAGSEMPDARCFGDLSCTSDAPEEVSAESLGRLVANEELRSIFDASDSTIFGRDSRPVDGSLLSVSLGEQSLLIGDECPSASDCRAIPEILSELRETLLALDEQMREVERCIESGG